MFSRGGTVHRCHSSVRTSVRGSRFDTISVQQEQKINLLVTDRPGSPLRQSQRSASPEFESRSPAPHHHCHLTQYKSTRHSSLPVRSRIHYVDSTPATMLAEYLSCYTYPLILTSCVFSLCSPLPPDCLSLWSVCS